MKFKAIFETQRNLSPKFGDPKLAYENRNHLRAKHNLFEHSFYWMDQIHGSNIVNVDNIGPKNKENTIPECDGLISNKKDVVLAVMVADCVPVLFVDPENGVIAAAHAGRRGACEGIVPKMIDKMIELGSKKDNINVFMGPAASGDYYELPEDMALGVESQLPGSLTKTIWGTHGVDLRRGILRQLNDQGISKIQVDPRNTIADEDIFSYRRDSKKGLDRGRFAGLVWFES